MPEMLQQMLGRATELFGGFLPNMIGAVGILVVGWIVALIARSIVRGALKRTTIDNQVAQWVSGGQPVEVERHAGTAVYWIIMLFVVIAVLQALNLTAVAEPFNALLSQLALFVPQLVGAAILLLVAWVVASALKKLVAGALRAARFDERIGGAVSDTDDETVAATTVADSLGQAVYWLVFLLFLPAILGALTLEGLLAPVQSLVDELLGFLPNILSACLIAAVGWFIANLVRRIVTNLLAAVGADSVAERVGLGTALGTTRLSGLIGLVVYVLILLPVLVSALDALALDAVTAPASELLGSILGIIPGLFGVVVLLTITYFIGRMVAELTKNVLAGVGFDNILMTLGLAKTPGEGRTPSDLVGALILVALMLFASIEAAGMLGFEVLAQLVSRFIVMSGQVVLGLVIFGLGLFLANIAASTVRTSAARQAPLLALVTRVSVLVLAGAMALSQMGLATEIINLAFGLLLGAIAVATALAFGLGARDVAGRTVEEWSQSLKRLE